MKVEHYVVAKNPDLPIRTSYGFYQRAIIVSIEPFVIAAPDATAVWRHYNQAELIMEGRAKPEELRIASTRYRTDLLPEFMWDFTKDVDGNPVPQVEPVNPYDDRTAEEVFALIQDYMTLEGNLWITKPEYLITVDDERLISASTVLGTLSLRKETPIQTSYWDRFLLAL